MRHPLSSFGSNDFEGVADFSQTTIVNDNSDFGDYDEGLGRRRRFKIKKPKFKKPSIKSISKLANPSVIKKLKLNKLVSKQLAQVQKLAKKIPMASQVQALANKATALAAKAGIPVSAFSSKIKNGNMTDDVEITETEQSTEAPRIDTPEILTAQATPSAQAAQVVASPSMQYNYSHPMLKMNRKIKGGNEGLSGWMDDLYNAQKKIVQNVIDTQKTKAITAATTQATNLVGKQLANLSKTNPAAQQAIAQTISTATAAATSAAQNTAIEKAKALFEENKKYIFIAGGAIVGLLVLKSVLNKKKV